MKAPPVATIPICVLLLAGAVPLRSAAQDAKQSKTDDPTDHSSPPTCKHCPAPRLPSGTRTTQIPIIKLSVKISAEGDVEDIRVVSAPSDDFVDEATKAVKKWKFKPARDKEGKPFPVRVTIEVKFNFVPGLGR